MDITELIKESDNYFSELKFALSRIEEILYLTEIEFIHLIDKIKDSNSMEECDKFFDRIEALHLFIVKCHKYGIQLNDRMLKLMNEFERIHNKRDVRKILWKQIQSGTMKIQ